MNASRRCPFRLSEVLFPKTDHTGYAKTGSKTKPAKATLISIREANENPFAKYNIHNNVAIIRGGIVTTLTTCAILFIKFFLFFSSIILTTLSLDYPNANIIGIDNYLTRVRITKLMYYIRLADIEQ
jgi:hypothetical protein